MSKLVENVTLGADPELFVMNETTGEIVSAEGFVLGTKYEPHHFDKDEAGYCTSLDNVMAEFTIPPVKSAEEMCRAIYHGIDFINGLLPKGLKTVAVASAVLDPKHLQTESAKTFGCEPDYNVWTRSINPQPKATNKNLRSAGGHIHIGYDSPDMETNEKLVKACDIFLGLPSILLDTDVDRRKLYGKAGCFRMPSHGIEYRVLSNFWTKTPELVTWAYTQTMAAVDFVNAEMEVSDEDAILIQKAINNVDKELATKLIEKYQLELA